MERLKFIRHARELGFEVDAIRELLDLAEQPQRSCAKVDALAREHLQAIISRIERLTALKAEVESMIKACAQGPDRQVPGDRRAVASRALPA